MPLQQLRRRIPQSPRLPADWLSAAVFVVVSLALLVGALTVTLADGTTVQSQGATVIPNNQAASNASLEWLSADPTPTIRAIRSPVPNNSGPIATERPQPSPTSTPSPQPTSAVTATTQELAKPVVMRFGAADWQGGYFHGDDDWYGRPWTAVWSAGSPHPRVTLTVQLADIPRTPASLTISGLDDQFSGTNPISITVNGVEIFSGPSPFANWDGKGQGDKAVWTKHTFEVPEGILHEGANKVSVANLSSTNSSSAPYFLVSDAVLEIDL